MYNIHCFQANCDLGAITDKHNFGVWVKELNAAFKEHDLLLSAAVSASKTIIDEAYDVETLGEYLDFINIMSYDFHAYWDGFTGHHSSLYRYSEDAADYLNTVSTRRYHDRMKLECRLI